MRLRKSAGVVAVALFASPLLLSPASAQFSSIYPRQLPQDDFTWSWGDQNSSVGRLEDFSVFGSDQGFRCDLNGKLRVTSTLSRTEIRQLESELRESMFFIQTAANTMYAMEQRRDLDWATLVCARPQRDEDQEKRDAREARALEKAAKELERRRARRLREEERANSD